ncbi:MAG: amidohydrolase [Anaerolineae bacterium]|nr:amidohydrolase [Anaerolineae bacterium]
MVIDTHGHIILPEITYEAAPEESWRPKVYWQDGKQMIDYMGKQLKSAVKEFVDIEQILKNQEEAGVDRLLLAPWVSILRYKAPAEEGLRTSRIQNEALAKLAAKYPGQISALGTVPLQDPELAAKELRSIMKEPGIHGVEIAASVDGKYLGDESFLPFWEAAEDSGAFVFIHPSIRAINVPEDFYMWNSVGNPLETTATAAHMILAGVMETFPNLKVLLAHGGGAILSLRGRLRHAHSFQPQAKSKLKESPEDSLKRFYFDTVVHDPGVLRSLIEYVGVEHVCLGSDYPFDMGDLKPAEIVRALNLPQDDEKKILSGNAAGLLGLKV